MYGVKEVKCLHIWSLTLIILALEAKIVIANNENEKELLEEIELTLRKKLYFSHINVELIKKIYQGIRSVSDLRGFKGG